MSTTTYDAKKVLAARDFCGWVTILMTVGWAALGVLALHVYFHHVNELVRTSFVGLSGPDADIAMVNYYQNAYVNIGIGFGVWIVGLLILAVMLWKTRKPFA